MAGLDDYTRAKGYPVKETDKGGSVVTDRYYGAWASILDFSGASIGEPCPIDPSLSLTRISISRTEDGGRGYVDLVYQPADSAGQSGNVDSNIPVWTCRIATLEKPLETHPDYRTLWNYNLVIKTGEAAPEPTWANDSTTLEVDDPDIFKWVKDEIPDGYNICAGYERQIPGVESYILPSPVVESVYYYSNYRRAVGALSSVGSKETPARVFGMEGGEWLVMGCDVSLEGSRWAVRTSYQWAEEWNDKLYGGGSTT